MVVSIIQRASGFDMGHCPSFNTRGRPSYAWLVSDRADVITKSPISSIPNGVLSICNILAPAFQKLDLKKEKSPRNM